MKTLLKLTFIFVLTLGLAYSSFGQGVTQDITSSAEVRTAISFTAGNANVAFGLIADVATGGTQPQVAPDGTATNTIGGTQNAADFTISASNSTSLSITYDQTTALDDNTDNFNIGFNTLVYSNATDDASTGGTTQSGGSFTASTNASGDLYIFVGGQLDTYDVSAQTTPATLTSGNGDGDITFSVSYN